MKTRTVAFAALAAAALLAWMTAAASADELVTRTKAGTFDDVKFELGNAIIVRGLVVDYTGQIGQMLDRTGADVGSTRKLYRQAEYVLFCSAKLSRGMMEADPANIGFCPFVVFIYERADRPGEIVVGYRRPPPRGDGASQTALAEVDKLLNGIIADAVK
jgi:hypothetical protein